MAKQAKPKSKGKKDEMPPAYDPQAVEDVMYERWEASGYFNPDNLPGKRTKPFTIIMPPPNATGTLHVGHAMFLTVEDLMIRFHRMNGKATLWLPGTDHAAIATNTKVEKILAAEGKTKYDFGRAGFIKRVEEFVAETQGVNRRQIRKLGASCDWSREAYTLDAPRSAVVRKMFADMYRDGLIYRGYRIVNWCPRCESTLADDEVAYKEEAGKLYFIKYGPFVVATTRPETKLGDTAVAVNPEDKRYKKWIGETFIVDFGTGSLEIRVIADGGVDMAFGSGVVGVTPAHSAADFAMAEKNNLPIKKVIGEDGKMTAAAGKYAGMPAVEARKKLADDLAAAGLIEKVEDLRHNLSTCYRCGTVIEPLTSRQWFVDVNKPVPKRGKSIKRLALDAVKSKKIRITPDRFEKTYFHWMNNLRDWCISRQIWFGHRIPAWYCQSCYVDDAESGRAGLSLKQTGRHQGIIVSEEPPQHCPHCKRTSDETSFVQDPDTLDTWFSSGTWTFSTLGWPAVARPLAGRPATKSDFKRFHPTQVLETGYDILFFWVARMIMMTIYATGQIPFERVYLHGLVRDEKGRKMSKSLGNIIDPRDVGAKYGMDAVRLSLVIGNSPGNDVKLSEEKIAYFRNFTNKLWNVSRFIAMNATAKAPTAMPKPKTLADKWIIGRLAETAKSVAADIEALQFSRPGETLRDFTWNELADWYLEIAKIEKGKEQLLAWILDVVLRLWHPFTPFVTEEIYRRHFAAKANDFLMVRSWPKIAAKLDKTTARDFALIRELVTALRALRAAYRIEPGREIELVIYGGAKSALLKKHATVIKGLVRLGSVRIEAKGKRPATSAGIVVGGVQAYVPLGGIVDVAAERSRIEKEIEEATRYSGVVEAKLKNPEFTGRAPKHVVDAEKAKLREQREKIKTLRGQLQSLR